MSTITVTNIKATGETASRSVSGVAAAWLNYNHPSNIVRQSLNVSSVTDNATGHLTKNYTNNMSVNDHVVGCTAQESGGSGPASDRYITLARGPSRLLAGSVQFVAGDVDDQMGTLRDQSIVVTTSHGDLA